MYRIVRKKDTHYYEPELYYSAETKNTYWPSFPTIDEAHRERRRLMKEAREPRMDEPPMFEPPRNQFLVIKADHEGTFNHLVAGDFR